MSCSRCGRPVVTPEQFDRGLCATCLTASSLSALVALAADTATTLEPLTRDREWKARQFPESTSEVM